MTDAPYPPLHEQKRALRRAMLLLRQNKAEETAFKAKALADVFLENIHLPESSVVAAYVAFRGEADPSALIEALRRQGHKIALPVIAARGEPLIFRFYDQGDGLILNMFGIPEPTPDAPLADPDAVLVPLLAFDRRRNRLGYGGGFYDRTIAALKTKKPTLAIGLAHSFQETDKVPCGFNDFPLDKIVTERSAF